MVLSNPAAYLPERYRQEIAAVVDGAVLIPGAAGALPELQQIGFHYAT
jgi:hypothetical protein